MPYTLAKVGIADKKSDMVSYNGFCGFHDRELFREIDVIADLGDVNEKQMLLLFYRSLAHERHKNICIEKWKRAEVASGIFSPQERERARNVVIECVIVIDEITEMMQKVWLQICNPELQYYSFTKFSLDYAGVLAAAMFSGIKWVALDQLEKHFLFQRFVTNIPRMKFQENYCNFLYIVPEIKKSVVIIGYKHDYPILYTMHGCYAFRSISSNYSKSEIEAFLTFVLLNYTESFGFLLDAYERIEGQGVSKILGVLNDRARSHRKKAISANLNMFDMVRA